MTLDDIETLARRYAEARQLLGALVGALEADIDDLKRRHLPGIREALGRAAEAAGDLHTSVEHAPELFEKPRTRTLHGIKVGWVKGKGVLAFNDAERVVQLILKHLPEQAEVLVKTRRTPVKKALAQLAAHDLKRIGVRVEGGDDQVVVKPMDGEIERLVDTLMGAVLDEEKAA